MIAHGHYNKGSGILKSFTIHNPYSGEVQTFFLTNTFEFRNPSKLKKDIIKSLLQFDLINIDDIEPPPLFNEIDDQHDELAGIDSETQYCTLNTKEPCV